MNKEISETHVRSEVEKAMPFIKENKIGIVPLYQDLIVYLTMYAKDNELYLLKFDFSNYREQPPLIQFIDPSNGVLNNRNAYPQTKEDSFFHDNGPTICAPFNRGAYATLHSDWVIGSWDQSEVQGTKWSQFSTFI